MPEGDTIHRAARALNQALRGKRVTHFESVFPALNRVHEDQPITGRTLTAVESRGKHLLMHVSGGLSLRTHMRMSGSWHIYRHAEAWQRPRGDMRILLETSDFRAVAFLVHEAEWIAERALGRSKLARLGPDVLDDSFDAVDAVSRMQARGAQPIGDVLLDQTALAGIGNVYKSELLFLAGIDPRTPASAISAELLRELARLAQQQLRANVRPDAAGAIVTYYGLRRTTGRSDPSERLWVYGRKGEPCRRCGTPIESALLGKHVRQTFYCPYCQRP